MCVYVCVKVCVLVCDFMDKNQHSERCMCAYSRACMGVCNNSA
jgi:hypothetical protein